MAEPNERAKRKVKREKPKADLVAGAGPIDQFDHVLAVAFRERERGVQAGQHQLEEALVDVAGQGVAQENRLSKAGAQKKLFPGVLMQAKTQRDSRERAHTEREN